METGGGGYRSVCEHLANVYRPVSEWQAVFDTRYLPPVPPTKTRDQTQAETRERLLDAARELFARVGYAGASVDAIAAAAGYTKGAVYANFASKEEVFVALLRRHKDEELAAFRAAVEAPGGTAEALAALGALLGAAGDGPRDADWALLSVELQRQGARSPALAAEYAALQAEQCAAFARLIEALFARAGRALPAPALELSGMFIALAHGLVLQRGPGAGGRQADEGRMLALVLESVLAAAPAAGPARRR